MKAWIRLPKEKPISPISASAAGRANAIHATLFRAAPIIGTVA